VSAPREPVDLAPSLRDAYLTKVAFGKGCETLELTLHVLRRALGSRESERDRVVGLRLRGVRALASEAVRWDMDAAKWVAAKVDWLGALARDQMERPIVGTAQLDSPASRQRWEKSAPEMLWLKGSPEVLTGGAVADAPALLEIAAEVVLPNGWNANARMFVAADALEIAGSKGALTVTDILRQGAEWTGKWLDYWSRKERGRIPEGKEEPQYDWIAPEE